MPSLEIFQTSSSDHLAEINLEEIDYKTLCCQNHRDSMSVCRRRRD